VTGLKSGPSKFYNSGVSAVSEGLSTAYLKKNHYISVYHIPSVTNQVKILGCAEGLDNEGLEQPSSGVNKFRAPVRPVSKRTLATNQCLWVLSMELAPSQPSGAQNSEVAPTGKSVHSLVQIF